MRYCYLFTSIAIMCAAFSVKAQSNYKLGYVIGIKGDTTKGFIDYQEWNDNPTYIRFKESYGSKIITIKPDELQFFDITGLDSYQHYYGPVSMDRRDQVERNDRDTSNIIKHVLLKVLQRGPNIILYSFNDEVKQRFFIRETNGDSPIRELIYKVYFKNDVSVTDKMFIQQLFAEADKFKLNDTKAISRLENAEYNLVDITKTITSINHFSDKDVKPKTLYKPVNRFLGIGVNIAHFTTNTIQSKSTLNNTSVLPQLSGGIDVLLNPNTGRFALRLEGLISGNMYKANFDNATSPYFPLHYSFTQIGISIIPQFVYNIYNTDKLKVYLSPGVQICILNYTNKKFYSTNSGVDTPINSLFDFESYFITGRIKAGVKISNRVDISIAYQIPEQLTTTNLARVQLNTIGAGLNYYF